MNAAEGRFWSKVNKTDDCWLWTASGSSDGYGRFWLDGTKKPSHRVAYEWLVGPIPEGMELDHICHVRACVNPDHLRPASRKQNNENLVGALRNSRSGVRGVSWDEYGKRWKAMAQHNGEAHLRHFNDFGAACEYVVELRNRLFTHNDADRVTTP